MPAAVHLDDSPETHGFSPRRWRDDPVDTDLGHCFFSNSSN